MKQLLMSVFLLIPVMLTADFDLKEGYSVKGKIASVKTSSKYASVEKCQNFADSRSKIVAFTYDSKKKKTSPPNPIFKALLVDRNAPINMLDKASFAR